MHWIGLLVLILDILSMASVLFGQGSLGHKLLWTLVIFILPVVGLILYLLLGRNAADA